MSDPVRLCLQGRISPEVALARLLLGGETGEGVARRVREAAVPSAAWTRLSRLVTDHAEQLSRLRTMLDAAGVDHEFRSTPAAIAALFDRAVAVSPEASVAMYSLGDPAILAAATDELAAWLDDEKLVGPEIDILDLGCGIGRVAAALAPRARSVLGLDVSAGMVAEARRRCAGLPGLRFAQTSGSDLSQVPDDSVDLVLAVDSFPYLHQAGLAERHIGETARVLRDEGGLAILNLSYRGDRGADHDDVATWALRYGFSVRHSGMAPFTSWDGTAYVLIKTGPARAADCAAPLTRVRVPTTRRKGPTCPN
jgi:SAM-dependent methyltransferase